MIYNVTEIVFSFQQEDAPEVGPGGVPKGSKTSAYYRTNEIPQRFDNPGNYAITKPEEQSILVCLKKPSIFIVYAFQHLCDCNLKCEE